MKQVRTQAANEAMMQAISKEFNMECSVITGVCIGANEIHCIKQDKHLTFNIVLCGSKSDRLSCYLFNDKETTLFRRTFSLKKYNARDVVARLNQNWELFCEAYEKMESAFSI